MSELYGLHSRFTIQFSNILLALCFDYICKNLFICCSTFASPVTYIFPVPKITFNALMIRKILRSRSILQTDEYLFTLAVISYDIYFFTCNFPIAGADPINDYLSTRDAQALTHSPALFLSRSLTVRRSTCPSATNFSFFMNLAVNRIFRTELLDLAGRVLRMQRLKRMQPSNGFAMTPKHVHCCSDRCEGP